MFICETCGHIFDEDEIYSVKEDYGQTFDCCPNCGGNFTEAEQCDICGDWTSVDDLHDSVCENCISAYRYDFSECARIGEIEKEEIKLNSFLVSMFTTAEIEELLLKELEKSNKFKPVNCSPFINSDIEWFASKIKEVE
jgi:hypothetical protein